MIKGVALGASATLIAAPEVHSQEPSALQVTRPTEVVNAIDSTKKPIPLSVKVSDIVACYAHQQNWEYTTLNMNTNNPSQINALGRSGWEAVGFQGDRLLLKRPLPRIL